MTGCLSVGPDYHPPATPVPEEWQTPLAPSADAAAPMAEWWTVFGDLQLEAIVRAVRTNNMDLAAALARMDALAAQYGMARSALLPSVSGVGGVTWDRQTERVHVATDYPDNPAWLYQAGFSMQWELDVWGRIRRSMEAARGTLDASVEDLRHLLVMLQAQAAVEYITLRTRQQQLVFAEQNIALQEKTVALTRGRYDAGLTSELDVHQSEMNLAATRAQIPQLRADLTDSLNMLCLLSGRLPGTWEELRAHAPIPYAEALPEMLPADLLRRRPDIRSAERQLAAQTARIGVAKADFLPKFALNGSFAYAATDSGELWKTPAQNFSIGPSVDWALFTAGRVRNNVRREQATTRAVLAQYEQAVLAAYQECESALSAHVHSTKTLAEIRTAAASAAKSVELAETLYRNGLTNFQNVLDMQRQLAQYQDAQAQCMGAVAANLVAVYKAFGGGWTPDALLNEDMARVEQQDIEASEQEQAE
ncbi:MAG: efflux transporter outer membrane subunit [Verrucomicrobiota bacterium]|nr:efflux transporter outer membrane subunit [Verrucomicrobiota bacterium]